MALNQGSNSEKDRIEDLKSTLDSRNPRPLYEQQDHLTQQGHPPAVQDDWGDTEDLDQEFFTETAHISTFSRRVLYFSILFFIVAAGVGAFIYFRGANVISANNIDISVAGPITIGGGQELDLDITVKNQNSANLTSATMLVDYPDGTRDPANISNEKLHESDDLGPIPSGGSVTKQISAVLYGQLNEQENITITIEYQVENSNATYQKEKTVQMALNSVPVTVNVSSLTEVNSGQNLELDVNLTSNSTTPIQNLLLTGEFPDGFTFVSSDPVPVNDSNNSAWLVGTLEPGKEETVKIIGTLQGQDGENKAFNFATGIQSQANASTLSPQFLSTTQTVTIQKPFIGIDLALDGSTDDPYTTIPGQNVRADLTWINNSPTKVNDAKITVTLTGALLDKTAVQSDQGFYDSLANTITWDQTSNPELALLSPGDTGTMSFNLASLLPQISDLTAFHDGQITLSVSVSGTRVDSTGVPNEVLSTVTRMIDLDTALSIVPRVVYSTGAFTNTGPLPPVAEKPTTYTVILSVTNTFNDTNNVKVTATLPQYVQWLGQVSPSTEQVSYDPTTGNIEWDPDNVAAGTGFSTPPQQVAFQVSFTPSVSQVGTAPILVNNINITGTDLFTNDTINGNYAPLTTKINTDPIYRTGYEIVGN